MDALEKFLADSGIAKKDFADMIGCSAARLSQLLGGDLPSRDLIARIESATKGKVTFRDWVKPREAV